MLTQRRSTGCACCQKSSTLDHLPCAPCSVGCLADVSQEQPWWVHVPWGEPCACGTRPRSPDRVARGSALRSPLPTMRLPTDHRG